MKEILEERKSKFHEKISKAMSGSAISIKKAVKDLGIKEIQAMFAFEEEHKKRKGVLSLLQKLVDAHLNDVAKTLSTSGPMKDPFAMNVNAGIYREFVSDVVQSEETEQVLIDLGRE